MKIAPQTFPKDTKMGQNPKILPQILVPLAGLEPARSLDRGILRLITGGFLGKNLKKPPKKSKNLTIKNIRKTKINLAFFLEKLKKTCSQNPPSVLFKLKEPLKL